MNACQPGLLRLEIKTVSHFGRLGHRIGGGNRRIGQIGLALASIESVRK